MMEESVEDLKAQLARMQHEYELASQAEDALVKRVGVLTKALEDCVRYIDEDDGDGSDVLKAARAALNPPGPANVSE